MKMEEKIKVYVKIDNDNVIKEINSSIFIGNSLGFIVIDEGQGDKYSHAQSNYLEKGLMGFDGKYNYKLIDGKVVELTDEEKEKLFPTKTQELSQEEILRANLLKDNVAFKLQLAQQQKINANLLTQIAKLGGTQ
jgi:hypothetical protein